MSFRITIQALIVLFLALVPGCMAAADEPLMAGMSVVDITPPAEHMAGPLKARCVVFRQGQEQAAVVVCDVCYFTAERSGAARQMTSDKTGIPVSNIVVVATHTHSGPWHEGVSEKIVEAVAQAQAVTQPAILAQGVAQQKGLALKKASPFANTMVCELANDLCYYVPGQKSFIEGGYEVVNSWLAPGGGERLVESAVELLKDLDAPGMP